NVTALAPTGTESEIFDLTVTDLDAASLIAAEDEAAGVNVASNCDGGVDEAAVDPGRSLPELRGMESDPLFPFWFSDMLLLLFGCF
ncbi:hypothetical protein U1Q18_002995, partial [Sarracenia purpurea var. burkii]